MDSYDLENEKEYLNQTIGVINKLICKNQKELSINSNHIRDQLEYLHNTKLDPQEINNVFFELDRFDNNVKNYNQEIERLEKIKQKPFFGKITVCYKDDDFGDENYYIGLKNIKENMNIYVLDWRAPLSGLYYDGQIGENYITSEGKDIKVDLLKKRQYKISDGQLVYYIDTTEQIRDNILQDVLNENTSQNIKNIVQTIQKEQNVVIKNHLNENIIVNGVAGSGKTSIALHRIAYMLYFFNGKLNSNEIVFISPNKLFSKYIETLLPELGENNVVTYCAYDIYKLVDIKYSSAIKSERLEAAIINKNCIKRLEEKYSLDYFNSIKVYLQNLINIELFDNLTINNHQVSKQTIIKAFTSTNKTANVYMFVNDVLEKILNIIYPLDSETTKNHILKTIKLEIISKFNLDNIFARFINIKNFKIKDLLYEDYPTYAYFKIMLKGCEPDKSIKQVFIDEIQDYDPLFVAILQNLFPKAKFTLVGDINQNLFFKKDIINNYISLFDNIQYYQFDKSYRSTNNITNLGFEILNEQKNLTNIRNGNEPKAYVYPTANYKQEFVNFVNNNINEKKYYAIICKDKLQAQEVKSLLPQATLVINDDVEIQNNLVITTPLYSKGLEFDVVFLYNVNKNNYNTQMDQQSLYVATTRALHSVYMFAENDISSFIPVKYISN